MTQAGFIGWNKRIRTENAMTQAHAFKAAELCLTAQQQALWTQKPGKV